MPSTLHSIPKCLTAIGISTDEIFSECDDITQEFKIIKRTYFAKILNEHPDKGGDAEQFRQTRESFEVLRELYQREKVHVNGFGEYLNQSKKRSSEDEFESNFEGFGKSDNVPSYDYYEDAAMEEMPTYFVELAKSGRSRCVKCKLSKDGKKTKKTTFEKEQEGSAIEVNENTCTEITTTQTAAVSTTVKKATEYIPKSAIRVGSLDETSGTYGRWNHLQCWRVPSKVWSGLSDPTDPKHVYQDLIGMDEVLLKGVSCLELDDLDVFISHVMDSKNWAKRFKRKAKVAEDTKKRAASTGDDTTSSKRSKATPDETVKATSAITKSDSSSTSTSTALTKKKQKFVIPKPGQAGAKDASLMEGKRFVITGTFPEVGGGIGLSLGKDAVKKMIESFGGKVTSAVSGKTDYLVVGKEPGRSKVSKAESRNLPMLNVRTLQKLMYGETDFEAVKQAEPLKITSFSSGYGYNAIEY